MRNKVRLNKMVWLKMQIKTSSHSCGTGAIKFKIILYIHFFMKQESYVKTSKSHHGIGLHDTLMCDKLGMLFGCDAVDDNIVQNAPFTTDLLNREYVRSGKNKSVNVLTTRGYSTFNGIKGYAVLGFIWDTIKDEYNKLQNIGIEARREMKRELFTDKGVQNLSSEDIDGLDDILFCVWKKFKHKPIVCPTSGSFGIAFLKLAELIQGVKINAGQGQIPLFEKREIIRGGHKIKHEFSVHAFLPHRGTKVMSEEKIQVAEELARKTNSKIKYWNLEPKDRNKRDIFALDNALRAGGYLFPTNPKSKEEIRGIFDDLIAVTDGGLQGFQNLISSGVYSIETLNALGGDLKNKLLHINSSDQVKDGFSESDDELGAEYLEKQRAKFKELLSVTFDRDVISGVTSLGILRLKEMDGILRAHYEEGMPLGQVNAYNQPSVGATLAGICVVDENIGQLLSKQEALDASTAEYMKHRYPYLFKFLRQPRDIIQKTALCYDIANQCMAGHYAGQITKSLKGEQVRLNQGDLQGFLNDSKVRGILRGVQKSALNEVIGKLGEGASIDDFVVALDSGMQNEVTKYKHGSNPANGLGTITPGDGALQIIDKAYQNESQGFKGKALPCPHNFMELARVCLFLDQAQNGTKTPILPEEAGAASLGAFLFHKFKTGKLDLNYLAESFVKHGVTIDVFVKTVNFDRFMAGHDAELLEISKGFVKLLDEKSQLSVNQSSAQSVQQKVSIQQMDNQSDIGKHKILSFHNTGQNGTQNATKTILGAYQASKVSNDFRQFQSK